jgi:hypothetical protein
MNDTALAHRLVRKYLRQLDEALAPLPPLRRAELHGQIAAHLAEELPPDATDDEVAEALRQLGSAAQVAAEAGVPPRPAPAPADSLRWLGGAIRRRTWKFWAVLAVLVTAATVFASVLDGLEMAPILSADGTSGWWYATDARHQVNTEAGNAQQTTVPERWHQQQGLFVQVYNNSDYTQTILGYAPDAFESPGNARSAQLGLSTGTDSHGYPGSPTGQRYSLPVSIPPGQSRYLRVIWLSTVCNVTGGQTGIDNILLRVRVGWITRTEDMSLNEDWALVGTAQSTCAAH